MADEFSEQAENNGLAADSGRKKPRHLWKPGQSGNPGGRPKGLRQQVLDATDGGRDIVRVLAEILMNEKAKPADRQKSAEILLDRGFGKAIATSISVNATADGLPDGLSEAADVLLESIARRLSARHPGQLPPTVHAPVKMAVRVDGPGAETPASKPDPDR